jgi:hypothetical protein
MNMPHHVSAPSRPDTPPETARYVLLVDRQAKRSFDQREAAEQEAQRIRSRFPHLRVTVEDHGPIPKRA